MYKLYGRRRSIVHSKSRETEVCMIKKRVPCRGMIGGLGQVLDVSGLSTDDVYHGLTIVCSVSVIGEDRVVVDRVVFADRKHSFIQVNMSEGRETISAKLEL